MRAVVLILLITLGSCSGMKSGRFVKMRDSDTVASLAKEFKVPKWKIEANNQSSNLKPGDWVFIPQKRGVVGQMNKYQSSVGIPPGVGIKSGELLWPVPSSGRVSSPFGERWGKMHEGMDISARAGAKILAAQNGVVVYSGSDLGGYGKITVISHPGGYFTVYAHARKLYVSKGEKVHRGQVIAEVGSTGRSTGNHLHFEVRVDSRPLNPKEFLVKH